MLLLTMLPQKEKRNITNLVDKYYLYKMNIKNVIVLSKSIESLMIEIPVMDLYDRKIIGRVYGKKITAELATKAVKNACLNISDTTGIILHSDLGSQYTSDEFEKYLQEKGIIHSFSRKGNPYDNVLG